MSTLKQLATGETALVATIETAARAVNQIGTTRVGTALATLADAIKSAQARLAEQMAELSALLGTGVSSMDAMTSALSADLLAMQAEQGKAVANVMPVVAPVPEPTVAVEVSAPVETIRVAIIDDHETVAVPANRIADALAEVESTTPQTVEAEVGSNGQHPPKRRRR